MIKVGIVGCGKVADDHVALIRTIPDCEIVAVCDREELMAKQLCERFKISTHFNDVKSLLDQAQPDVVHVTTPPKSHFEVAKVCLQSNSHVFVEKPFTVNAGEAEELIELARQNNLKMTVNHDQQFTTPARAMRELIAKGYLGGPPVHVESYFGYDLGGASYAKALLGDRNHWVRQLPGKLLQNIISHGISKISEFLETDSPNVIAHGFVSPLLRSIEEYDIIDELRVIISDSERFTAYFTFSSHIRPTLHLLRVYGSKNAIEIDHDKQTLITIRGSSYKSFLEKIIPSCTYAGQYSSNLVNNVLRFVRRDLHPKSGSKYLIESLYKSITHDTPLPIPYKEIRLTMKIMDEIFSQIYRTE